MGEVSNASSALFQTVQEGLVANGSYRLCFDAMEVPGLGGTASFTLTAEMIFFSRFGNQIEYASQSYTAGQIPDNSSTRLCLNGEAPREAREVLVRLTFEPNVLNTSGVIIDNLVLECTRARDERNDEYFDFR